MVRALRDFVAQNEGLVPLPGTLPDMHSDTTSYVALQQAFHSKSQSDYAVFKGLVEGVLTMARKPLDSIPEATLKMYYKNAGQLQVLRYRSWRSEIECPKNLGMLMPAN